MTRWHAGAKQGRSGRVLGVDWYELNEQAVDPYLVWADLSGLRSIAREGAPGGDVATPDEALRIAVQFRPGDAPPELHGIQWHPLPSACGAQFATAFVRACDLRDVLLHPHVLRVELGFRAPAGHRLAESATPPTPPSRKRTKRPTVAVIDFGCAFAHERFRRLDSGTWRSRIAWLWDQGHTPDVGETTWHAVPEPGYGRELGADDIDVLLAAHGQDGRVDEDAVYRSARYDSVQPVLMHGTHVLDIAAGEDPAATEQSTADIIFVQLPDFAIDDTSGGSMVTHVLDALGYILARAGEATPLVVNLSYGAMAGPHDGSTLVETAMDALIEDAMGPGDRATAKPPHRYLGIVLPAGNSFCADGHAQATLSGARRQQTLHWQVQADNPTDAFLEVWYPRESGQWVEVEVAAPGGQSGAAGVDRIATLRAGPDDEPIAAIVHRRHASAGLTDAVALVALAPTRTRDGGRPAAPAGVWTVTIRLVDEAPAATAVPIHVWIERDDPPIGSGAPPRQSFLLTGALPLGANDEGPADSVVQRRSTCNSIANGARTIVVGACTAQKGEFRAMAAYSSAGPTRNPRRVDLRAPSGTSGQDPGATNWPDLVAPAEISSALSGCLAAGTRSGVQVRMNGTSVAAPQVARAIADRYLQAESKSPGTTGMGQHVVRARPPRRLEIRALDVPRAGRGLLVNPLRD